MLPTSCEPSSAARPSPLRIVRPSPRTAAAALAAAVLVLPAQSAVAAPAAGSPVVDVEACTAQGVDEPAVLPFPFTFYGDSYDEVHLGRNFSATFSGSPTFALNFPLPDLGAKIITPLYGEGSGDLTGWGTTTYQGHRAFCATWEDVGAPEHNYGGDLDDGRNTYQLLLVEREDRGPGQSDIVFNYESLQWGDGRAGFADGSGRPGSSFELRGPGHAGEHLDDSPTGLANTSTNSDVVGRHVLPTPTEEPAEAPERICFSSTRGGNTDIYSVTPAGTGTRRLTSDPAADTVPNLSPDGRRIAFDRAVGDGHRAMTMLSDGTGAYTYGYSGGTSSTTPTFASYEYGPDIQGFTYSEQPDHNGDGVPEPDRRPDIVAVYPFTEYRESLTGLPGTESTPAYSPDGELLAFTSQQGARLDVVVQRGSVDADDITRTTLTPPSMAAFDPTFSADGQRLVFTGIKDGNVDLYSMEVDGSDLRRLTTDPAVDATADFSPDGSRIVFSSTRTGRGDLYTMAPDGTDVRRLTNTPTPETEPAW